MSYTGVGIIGIGIAHDATTRDHTGEVAARDIIRANGIGQMVVVVPAGQPIPKWLDVEPGEAIPAPPAATPPAPDPEYLRRPEPDIGGQYRTALRTERTLNLLRRRPLT